MTLQPLPKRRINVSELFEKISTMKPIYRIALTSMLISLSSTITYNQIKSPTISFELQINDPRVSSTTNTTKLNSILGNTSANPTLIYTLVSSEFLCRNFFDSDLQFKTTNTSLVRSIKQICNEKSSFKSLIRAKFSKGERYEDLQVIKFTIRTSSPKVDIRWISGLARFYEYESGRLGSEKLLLANKSTTLSEKKSAESLTKSRQQLITLTQKFKGPLDKTFDLYQEQLLAIEKDRVSYAFERVKLISLLAAQLGIAPTQVTYIITSLDGLNKESVLPLLKALQDINVKLYKVLAISSRNSPEYKSARDAQSALIDQIQATVPGINKLISLKPNPDIIPNIIETSIKLKSLEYQIAQNKNLSNKILLESKSLSDNLPIYTIVNAKVTAQQAALSDAVQDNELLKIEINRMVATWKIISGPTIFPNNTLLIFICLFVVSFSGLVLFRSRLAIIEAIKSNV